MAEIVSGRDRSIGDEDEVALDWGIDAPIGDSTPEGVRFSIEGWVEIAFV
jgi:hypothetical protein